jgi:hypothetical protein
MHRVQVAGKRATNADATHQGASHYLPNCYANSLELAQVLLNAGPDGAMPNLPARPVSGKPWTNTSNDRPGTALRAWPNHAADMATSDV